MKRPPHLQTSAAQQRLRVPGSAGVPPAKPEVPGGKCFGEEKELEPLKWFEMAGKGLLVHGGKGFGF
jgi:hypothetical protein